ncbi:MAG: hypothetical protein DRN92_03095 [Thermoproteota archaeon]|nr:MAG: hypothetical protein DRN92_03095 [Candidatus Korarchaeota archaeon]
MDEGKVVRELIEEAKDNEYSWKLSTLNLLDYLNIDSDVVELCREVLAFAFDRVRVDSVLKQARVVTNKIKM